MLESGSEPQTWKRKVSGGTLRPVKFLICLNYGVLVNPTVSGCKIVLASGNWYGNFNFWSLSPDMKLFRMALEETVMMMAIVCQRANAPCVISNSILEQH